jgi:hypothetical protein
MKFLLDQDVEYSDLEVEKHGYPNFPPEKSQWDNISEVFIFCSKKLPAYIEYDEEKKKFTGAIPFGQDGFPSGATEGIANLYLYICDNIRVSNGSEHPGLGFVISSELGFSEIAIEKPTDIFNYPIK